MYALSYGGLPPPLATHTYAPPGEVYALLPGRPRGEGLCLIFGGVPPPYVPPQTRGDLIVSVDCFDSLIVSFMDSFIDSFIDSLIRC